jgi:signal recognition particle subunit SRP54
MFDGLTERLSGVFDRLGGRGVLSEKDIDEALREVRVALLEADVALPVVKDFISKAKEAASAKRSSARSSRPTRWSRSSMTAWSTCWAARSRPA